MATLDPRRVEALFDAVVDLEEGEARRHLAAACADAPHVRRQVELLLAQDRSAGADDLTPIPALLLEALREGAHAAPEREPAQPTHLGRFRVLDRLGAGASGVVYAGHDESLDRRVALKLLRGEMPARDWLLREGQALGRVTHPNVVTVYEVGEHAGGIYLAMELVEGPTLRAWLGEERRSFAEVLRMFMQVGEGLVAVHAAGLMHRDFKPDNVLVGRDGRPQIADFGIASLVEAADPPRGHDLPPGQALEVTIARGGHLAGTPAFMAPEVLAGARATAASDQWSFCAALYRAAYGSHPFPMGDGDVAAFARRVNEGPAPTPPRRADVPLWLAPILLRGLARDPADRFASQGALLAAIERKLPRDPELDPLVVRRDIYILRLAVLLTAIFAGLVIVAWPLPIVPATLAFVTSAILATELVVITIRWRSLAQNLFGRRSAGIMVSASGATLLHRLLALRMETPFEQILAVDLLLLGLVYFFAAMAIDRWIAALAVTATAAATVAVLWPAVAVPAFVVGTLGTFLVVTADAYRRR